MKQTKSPHTARMIKSPMVPLWIWHQVQHPKFSEPPSYKQITRTHKRRAQRKNRVMMRKMLGTHASFLEPREVRRSKVYHTLTGMSETEDKELMRHAILKEIEKAIKN